MGILVHFGLGIGSPASTDSATHYRHLVASVGVFFPTGVRSGLVFGSLAVSTGLRFLLKLYRAVSTQYCGLTQICLRAWGPHTYRSPLERFAPVSTLFISRLDDAAACPFYDLGSNCVRFLALSGLPPPTGSVFVRHGRFCTGRSFSFVEHCSTVKGSFSRALSSSVSPVTLLQRWAVRPPRWRILHFWWAFCLHLSCAIRFAVLALRGSAAESFWVHFCDAWNTCFSRSARCLPFTTRCISFICTASGVICFCDHFHS